jgi:hypothetical protein
MLYLVKLPSGYRNAQCSSPQTTRRCIRLKAEEEKKRRETNDEEKRQRNTSKRLNEKKNANMPIWCFVSFLEALFP